MNYSQSPSIASLQGLFNARYGFKPDRKTIKRIHLKFMQTGSVHHKKGAGRPRSSRTELIETVVLAAMKNKPNLSIRKLSSEFGISYGSVQQILRTHKLKPYKLNSVHGLKEDDPVKR